MYYQGVREALAHIIHNKNIRQILFQNPDAVPNIVSENMLSNNDNILQFQKGEGEIGAISSQLKPWARMSQEERKQLLTSLNATLAGRNQYNEQLLVYDMIMAQIGAPGYSGASPHAANTGWTQSNYRYARKRADAAGVNLEQAENDLLAAYNIRNEDPAPIIEAAKSGDINRVSHLITIGADVNTADSNGDTPLMVSLRTGKADVATELIKRGAEINHRNNAGMTPLLEAVTHGHFDLATSMIANGADYTVKTPGENGKSIEEILVEYREAHPNEGNAVEGVLSVIQRQKESVVNTGQQEQPAPSTTPEQNPQNNEEENGYQSALNTPLIVAIRDNNKEEALRLIRENPMLVNTTNRDGDTPLHWVYVHVCAYEEVFYTYVVANLRVGSRG